MYRFKSKKILLLIAAVVAVIVGVIVYMVESDTTSVAPAVSIKDTQLQATFAITDSQRTRGLSGAPILTGNQAKVFVFDDENTWSIWMKDMNGPIDIVWLDTSKKVVHIVSEAQPSSYPKTIFTPPTKSKYVIETTSGLMARSGIVVGDQATFDTPGGQS